jgi:hypothetical protein
MSDDMGSPDFSALVRIVLGLTGTCALLALAVGGIGASWPLAYSDQLFVAFIDTFRLGSAAILGLLSARAATARRK